MRQFRQRRTHWAWVAIVALLGNVFASAFCCAPSFAKKTEIVDAVLGTLTLCSDRDGGSADSKQLPGSKTPHCPICLGLAQTALLVTAFVFPLWTPNRVLARAAYIDRHESHAPLKLGGLGSRAPPLPA